MHWILIIFVNLSGCPPSQIEFNTLEACEYAKGQVELMNEDFITDCVPKGPGPL